MDRITDLKRLRDLATEPAEIAKLDGKIAKCQPPASSAVEPAPAPVGESRVKKKH